VKKGYLRVFGAVKNPLDPELRSSGEGSFSRGDAEGAENFLKMTEIQGFAIPDSQSFRSNFGFQV
jgi:hypothetical protein